MSKTTREILREAVSALEKDIGIIHRFLEMEPKELVEKSMLKKILHSLYEEKFGLVRNYALGLRSREQTLRIRDLDQRIKKIKKIVESESSVDGGF